MRVPGGPVAAGVCGANARADHGPSAAFDADDHDGAGHAAAADSEDAGDNDAVLPARELTPARCASGRLFPGCRSRSAGMHIYFLFRCVSNQSPITITSFSTP